MPDVMAGAIILTWREIGAMVIQKRGKERYQLDDQSKGWYVARNLLILSW